MTDLIKVSVEIYLGIKKASQWVNRILTTQKILLTEKKYLL